MRIAVLVGGTSPERDVSLATGRGIIEALRGNGHDVVAIDTGEGRLLEGERAIAELESASSGGSRPRPSNDGTGEGGERRLPDFRETEDHLIGVGPEAVFIALHGGAGEDGRLQAVLDLVGIPYTGSGYLGSGLAMDKLVSKELFTAAGIPTPPWLVGPATAEQIRAALSGFPVVVKPSRQGSTVGVTVVREEGGLEGAFESAAAFGGPVLVERYIPGRELAVGILDDRALPIVEIRPSHEIYDYQCKYTSGMSQYEVPAPLTGSQTRELQLLALEAHRILRLSAYSRIDFRVDEDGRFWCLEANSLPGMTETSLLPKAAAAAGVSFGELCERILRMALQQRSDAGTRVSARG